MDENCTHDCSSCSAGCSSKPDPQSLLAPMNANSNVKNVIAVVSGKGGVGKSLVTSLLACGMKRSGHTAAILDADLTGPSIPKLFGVDAEMASAGENGLEAMDTASGVKVMSVNLLLPDTTDPVVWRGPVISGVVKQFWSDVCWGDVDYMFVDMPPGTGDVALTVFQSLPIKGIVIVASPQELVGMIVEKAVKMAELMDVPVLGLIENMSYFECSDCGKRHKIFGDSHIDEIAAKHHIRNIAKLPMDPAIPALCDKGQVDKIEGNWLDEFSAKVFKD